MPDKGFTNDTIPALSVCESPIEGKFVQAFFDAMTGLGMNVEYSTLKRAKLVVTFSPTEECDDDFWVNAKAMLWFQSQPFGGIDAKLRFDLAAGVSSGEFKTDMFIELDGKDFHNSPDQRLRDGRKSCLAFNTGIPLLRIPGNYVYSNASECVSSVLSYLRSTVEYLELVEQRAWCHGRSYAIARMHETVETLEGEGLLSAKETRIRP